MLFDFFFFQTETALPARTAVLTATHALSLVSGETAVSATGTHRCKTHKRARRVGMEAATTSVLRANSSRVLIALVFPTWIRRLARLVGTEAATTNVP